MFRKIFYKFNADIEDRCCLIKQSGSKTVDYNYDKENHLLRATIQQGNSVTIESYTYDYAGNRLSKMVNENSTTYYVNDTSGSLTQVVAETDKDGKETTNYTGGDDLLSMERGRKIILVLKACFLCATLEMLCK